MHKKIGKDRTFDYVDMLADRQTDRQTCSSQYFATALAGEVTSARVRVTKLLLDYVVRLFGMRCGSSLCYCAAELDGIHRVK